MCECPHQGHSGNEAQSWTTEILVYLLSHWLRRPKAELPDSRPSHNKFLVQGLKGRCKGRRQSGYSNPAVTVVPALNDLWLGGLFSIFFQLLLG